MPLLPERGKPYLWKRLLSASCFHTLVAAPVAEENHSNAELVASWQALGRRGHVSGPKDFVEQRHSLQSSHCSPHHTCRSHLPENCFVFTTNKMNSNLELEQGWKWATLTQIRLDLQTRHFQGRGGGVKSQGDLKTSSPGNSWTSGTLWTAGWGWPCKTLSALSECRMFDSLLALWIFPICSGWWQNGGTSHGPFQRKSQSENGEKKSADVLTEKASLVGQDVSNGLIAETDKEASRLFISQQILSVPDWHNQKQVFLATFGLIFKHTAPWFIPVQTWSTLVLLYQILSLNMSLSNKRKQPCHVLSPVMVVSSLRRSELAYFLAAKPWNQSGKFPSSRICDACVSVNHLITSSFRPPSEASKLESTLMNFSILSRRPTQC